MSQATNARPQSPVGDELRDEFQDLFGAAKDLAFTALQDKALSSVRDAVHGVTERLNEYVEQGGGGPGLMAAVRGAEKLSEGASPTQALLGAGAAGAKGKLRGLFGGGRRGGGQGRKLKMTNIVESIDVGVPVRVAYNQWTQFGDFPKFMKKVENVDSPSDEKLNWKAQVFWSHRNWEATIRKQVPDELIVWRSKGQKGHVDGSVSFHELAPNLTRILLVLEYHPQGLFERTGNLWRAQGRRARLEFKNFRRHVMTQVALNPDDVEGWRGVIEDGEVVKDHETAVREEQEREQGGEDEGGEQAPEDRAEEQPLEDEAGQEEVPEGEADEDRLAEDEAGQEEPPGDEPDEADEADEAELPEDAADEDLPADGDADEDQLPEDEAEPPEDEGDEEEKARPAVARRRGGSDEGGRAGRTAQRAGGTRDARSRRPAAARTGRGRA